jgi:hypothetical protein
MTNRHTSLATRLRSLNLTTMADLCESVAVQAARESWSHLAFLDEGIMPTNAPNTYMKLKFG